MATRTVVCPECETPLPPGRFSCSACGALVASVASAGRPFIVPDVLPTAAPEATVADETGHADEAPERPASVEQLLRTAPADDGWDEVREELDRAATNGGAPHGAADDLPLASAVAAAPAAEAPDAEDRPAAEPADPAWPDHPTWPLPTVPSRTAPPVLAEVAGAGSEELLVAEITGGPPAPAATPAAAVAAAEPAMPRVPAGVYLPPSAVLPPAEALPLPGSAATTPKPDPTRRRLRDLGGVFDSLAMPADAGTRVIAVGGGIAAFGFLLPWAGVVIGSRTLDDGLLSTWGLAGPAAPLAFLLTLTLTALAVLRPNLPAWVGLSTPAVALGALLIGILWPYLFGPFGATIGVYVVAVGAILTMIGGLVDRLAGRHGEPPTAV